MPSISPTNEPIRDRDSADSPDSLVLTERHFFKYAACPHWIWFDHFGDPAKRAPPPPLGQLFQATFATDRGALIQKALKRQKIREINAVRPEDAYAQTLLRMKEGAQAIAKGTLSHGRWLGHPDLLLRRKGSSSLGSYHYLPVIVERGSRARSLQKILLAFWAILLETTQGLRPKTGLVIGKDGKREVVPIDRVLLRTKKTADEIEAILAGNRPAPFLSGGCRESPWFSECVRIAEEAKDLTLIAGLTRGIVQSLRAHDISTIADAAAINSKALQGKASGFSRSALSRIKDQAAALLNDEVIIHKRPRFPRATTELFLDLEGDPLRGIDYLIGVLIVDRQGVRYQPFFAKRPEEEKAMWRSFLAWLKKLPPNARMYHFGHYERLKLGKTLPERHGRNRALDRLMSNAIDLRKIIEACVVLPVYFYTLKDIGKCLAFRWSDSEAGGAQSVVWYEEWLAHGSETARAKVLEYNQNDVEATRIIKEWLAGLKKHGTA